MYILLTYQNPFDLASSQSCFVISSSRANWPAPWPCRSNTPPHTPKLTTKCDLTCAAYCLQAEASVQVTLLQPWHNCCFCFKKPHHVGHFCQNCQHVTASASNVAIKNSGHHSSLESQDKRYCQSKLQQDPIVVMTIMLDAVGFTERMP